MKYQLCSKECLCLNAGQLAYGSRHDRAIALALAMLATPVDWQGLRARVVFDLPSLIVAAHEVNGVSLTKQMAMRCLERLEQGGYLTLDMDAVAVGGVAAIIDTTTLGLRITEHDAPVTQQRRAA
jgi:hypothetical protein